MDTTICPDCGSNWQGAPIPQEAIDKGWYGDNTHFSRLIGVEVRGAYDGVLYWQCPDCGSKFVRFTDPTDRRFRLAIEAGAKVVESTA